MFGLLGVTLAANLVAESDTSKKPNFIILFMDDLGYGDHGCFGSEKIQTPNIDRMAAEGMRFTNFYAQTVCGPSRAALMTGCYPLRVAKKWNNQTEIHPMLHEQEITIAEILKQQGYANACFGEWDLAGHRQRGYEQAVRRPVLIMSPKAYNEKVGLALICPITIRKKGIHSK
jgi:arylsulfatase A-like enzyme